MEFLRGGGIIACGANSQIEINRRALKIPVIRGIIERRILVNFRVAPDVLEEVLPEPFRPKLIGGVGMAGICLIRLRHIRPNFLPAFVGISSENAAHRIAAQWESGGQAQEGVYVLRRDTHRD